MAWMAASRSLGGCTGPDSCWTRDDDAPAVVGADRSLDVVENAEAEMGAFLPEFLNLGGEVLELGRAESEVAMKDLGKCE